MATSTFSTLDALNTLCASIPDWNARLDELNGQIALRQIELAQLEEHERRPPTRSIKNKGSTESLRPRDGHETPFSSQDDAEEAQRSPFQSKSPHSSQNGFTSVRRHSSSRAARAVAIVTPPPPKASSNPRPSPGALSRQSSQPTPSTQPQAGPAVLRKRKTDSLASRESAVPKYRTRSMIIVYYDSAVQTAFEELVKFVSGSRNAMRKGKMAAKMAQMKRAAELEVEAEEAEENGDGGGLNDMLSNGNLMATIKKVNGRKQGQSLPDGQEDDGDEDIATPNLKYVSTRQMGPSRIMAPKAQNLGSALTAGILGGYRRAGGAPDIFDELDKGLEWCQGQCEHAAHQFLRDGECSAEIDNIKTKLSEVKKCAEKEVEKLKKENVSNAAAVRTAAPPTGRAREFKTPYIRREMGSLKDLEVDDMEVDDDEGLADLEPPKLVFKRSGQV